MKKSCKISKLFAKKKKKITKVIQHSHFSLFFWKCFTTPFGLKCSADKGKVIFYLPSHESPGRAFPISALRKMEIVTEKWTATAAHHKHDQEQEALIRKAKSIDSLIIRIRSPRPSWPESARGSLNFESLRGPSRFSYTILISQNYCS